MISKTEISSPLCVLYEVLSCHHKPSLDITDLLKQSVPRSAFYCNVCDDVRTCTSSCADNSPVHAVLSLLQNIINDSHDNQPITGFI